MAPPRLNADGLLAGVDAGVVLPRLPNKDGFGAACVPCVPDDPAWLAPLNSEDGAGDGCTGVVLFASVGASLFPPRLKKPPPPGVLPNDFAGVELEPALPKGLGADEVEVVAGFTLPKRFEVEDVEDVAGFMPPKREGAAEVCEVAPV